MSEMGLINRRSEEMSYRFRRGVLYKEGQNPEGTLYKRRVNLLKTTGYVMHQQFNIQQLYVLPTLYLCVLYLSENKQRLVPLIS